jgi:hypothetical protein
MKAGALPRHEGRITMSKTINIYASPALDACLPLNGGGRGRSHRISQIADRYKAILELTPLPKFSDGEWNFLRDVLNGFYPEPASVAIEGIWVEAEDALAGGYAQKWEIDGQAFVEKLRGLTFAQKVAVVEQVELWWKDQCGGGTEAEPGEDAAA